MALSGLISRGTSGLDKREVKDVLEGHLTMEHAKPVSKYIRIFLSSDLTDSKLERRFLRERVFPHLRSFSRSLGLQFHVVDLYHSLPAGWLCHETEVGSETDRGEEEEKEEGEEGEEVAGSATEQGGSAVMYGLEMRGVLQLALREIRTCQNMSAGPTFITLLGQKYGHHPLPQHIPEEEYTLLCGAMLDSADERQLVQQWYQLDSNAQPPQYTLLQPLQDCNEDWMNTHKLLSTTLKRAAKVALGKDATKVQKYIMSASEWEVTVGLFQLKADPNHCCLWSKRTFTDLLEQKPEDPALSLFCDLVAVTRGLQFDSDALKSLNHLKEARMPAKYIGLDANNIHEFPIKWHRGKGLDPIACELHGDYLTQMCERVCQTLEQQISEAADSISKQSCNPIHQEVLRHAVHCQEIFQTYMDRPDISDQIQSYLAGSSGHPLVVHGPTGYGKTTLMAAAAYHLREGNPALNMAIIVRFLGLTPHSSNIFHTLRSIIEQIMAVYDTEGAVIPGDYQGVSALFTHALHSATADKPLYLFLDAVDQLSPEDGASGMSWLPLALPPHVKLVLSTSSEVEYRCFPVLQSLLTKHTGSMVELPQPSEDECQHMLTHHLSLEQKALNPEQRTMALAAVRQCPVPLFLHVIMRQLRDWNSYTVIQEPLPTTIDDAVKCFYVKLEEEYGVTLVSHLLAYVTAAKHGLTEPELLDVLTLDAEVISEVNARFGGEGSPALLSLPPVIRAQLNHQLQPLLTYRAGVDHSLVLQWSHRRLRELAEERYLPHHRTQVYGTLADYFSGVILEKRDSESGHSEDNNEPVEVVYEVDSQPLLLNEHLQHFNIRKLTELPHALSKSGRYAYEALTELLFDYKWLKACILSLPCRDVLHDFTPVIPTVPIGRIGTDVDHELRLLRQTLIYSTAVLNVDRSQFCAQLAGRLLPYITHSPDKYPILRNLVLTALRDTSPRLTPLHPFSHIPGGPHLVSMEGHRDTVSCISTALVQGAQGVSAIILTASWDKTLKSWDLATTGVLKTFDGHSERVLSVALTADGMYAASGSNDKSVRYWYVPTAQCIHVMQGHSAAVNAVAVTEDGTKTISASSDMTVKVWNTDQNSSSCGQLIYTQRDYRRPVLSAVLRGDLLASGTSNGRIFLHNIVSGEKLKVVQGHSGAVTALAAEVVDGCCYLVSGAADGSVKVWDFSTCNPLHSLPTNSTGSISSISIGTNGRLIVSSTQREPGMWDMRSGTHLYDLPVHTATVQSTAMTDDGRLAITGSATPSLTIWDVLSPPVTHTTQLHREDVTSVALSGCGGLGVCTSKSGGICVFDTDAMTAIQRLQPHSAAVTQVLVYKDRNKLFSASADGTVCLWNGETGEILARFEQQENAVNCLAITATRDLLMTGSEDGEVAFWNIDTGKKLRTFSDHTSGVLAVAFITQKKDQFMFSSSRDGTLCIREFYSAKVVASSHLNTDELVCTALAPNATFIVCGSKKGSSYVVSLPFGALLTTLTGHSAAVNTIKVFSDSTKCVTGSTDRMIRVWSVADGRCVAVLHIDAPVLACDVNYNKTILYGMEGGWVSTAAFQSDPSKPNALISRLNERDSLTMGSSSLTSATSLNRGVETPVQNDEAHTTEDSTDQCEEHPQPSNQDDNSRVLSPTTEPEDDKIQLEFRDDKTVGYTRNGEINPPLSSDTPKNVKYTQTAAEDTPSKATTSKDSVTNTTLTKSSACIIL